MRSSNGKGFWDGFVGLTWDGDSVRPLSEASVPINDRGLNFGLGVFETLLVAQGHPVAWASHRARLAGALDSLGWALAPLDDIDARICGLARECVRFGAAPYWALKVLVTEGVGGTLREGDAGGLPGVYVSARPIDICYLDGRNVEELAADSLRLYVSIDERARSLRRFKTTGYLASLVALRQAWAAGCDDVVFLAENGFLSESSTASLAWIDGHGRIGYSDPDTVPCLPSTTLARLAASVRLRGGHMDPGTLGLNGLHGVKGAVLVSSLRGARAVSAIGSYLFDKVHSGRLAWQLNELLGLEVRQSLTPPSQPQQGVRP